MERLVYFAGDIALVDNLGIEECMEIQEPLKKLHDYEIAEEQGLLLRLPFKAGKEFYVITKEFNVNEGTMSYIIKEFEFKEFKFNFLKNFVIVGVQRRNGFYEQHFFLGDIGRVLFITKEEAEHKLESMKGE